MPMPPTKTLSHAAEQPEAPGRSDIADYDALLRERSVLSACLADLLRGSLRGLDWAGLPDTDRARLERSLTDLGADIPLLWLIRGQKG